MTRRAMLRRNFAIRLSLVVSLVLGTLYATQCLGQAQPEDTTVKLPAYEISTIKPDKSGIGPRILFRTDGLTATKVTLQFLIKMAYGVEDDQIIGAPGWLSSEGYDVEAKVDSSEVSELSRLSENQRMTMFQRLLVDRFRLAIHWETKELPVYALVIAKNGPKLEEAKDGDTYPNGIKGLDGIGRAGMMTWSSGRLIGQGISIAAMVPALTQQLGRTVQDRTGLTGKYEIELRWTPDDAAAPRMGPPRNRPNSDSGVAAESPEPSIFTAIQEQLGLKLESQKRPVDVLVIDRVDRPSAN